MSVVISASASVRIIRQHYGRVQNLGDCPHYWRGVNDTPDGPTIKSRP